MTKDQRIRYARLNQVFDKALTQSLTKLESWEKLRACFPEYSATSEGASNLVNCQKQVVEFWTELCRREFEEILIERDVKVKLDDLDDLISGAKERLRNMTPSEMEASAIEDLSSEQLVDCNLYGKRTQALEDLDRRLGTLNSMNKSLQEELKTLENNLDQGRTEIKEMCDTWIGKNVSSPPDETLVQGLADMLLDLRDI